MSAADIYGVAIKALEPIEQWFATQEDYCFYGCSVLLTYEGTAKTAEDAKVSVRLIDFAHSFDGQGKKVGPHRSPAGVFIRSSCAQKGIYA